MNRSALHVIYQDSAVLKCFEYNCVIIIDTFYIYGSFVPQHELL